MRDRVLFLAGGVLVSKPGITVSASSPDEDLLVNLTENAAQLLMLGQVTPPGGTTNASPHDEVVPLPSGLSARPLISLWRAHPSSVGAGIGLLNGKLFFRPGLMANAADETSDYFNHYVTASASSMTIRSQSTTQNIYGVFREHG